ncbi:MAG: serine/threonine-protein kinase [Myxococcota bacterium]|nr:serine/threonine-protein kinase [Myxococcota bacterium]
MAIDFPFTLQRPIGRGSYAKVWLAQHHETKAAFAIKVLENQGDGASQRAERLREVRLVARSAHPNILRVFGTGTLPSDLHLAQTTVATRGQQYLLTEYATGGSLNEHRRCRPWSEVRTILGDILSGLGRVHARGIVHLDMKPANILCCERGYVVADFGIARLNQMQPDDKHQGTLEGTPNYMAPEQITGHKHLYGPWTDLYAVGCLAHFLISGRPPFVRSTLMELLLAHKQDSFPQHEDRYDVPTGFDAWMARLTAKAWNQRFQRASEALRYLNDLDETKVHIESRTSSDPRWAPSRTNPSADRTLLSPTPFFAPENQLTTSGLSSVNQAHLSFAMTHHDTAVVDRVPRFGASLMAFEDCRLIGRRKEQDHLWHTFHESVMSQTSALVEIQSPAGLGKTSLADWLTTQAHERVDAEIFWVTHHPVPGQCDGFSGFLQRYFSLFDQASETYTQRIAARLAAPGDDALSADLGLLVELDDMGTSTMDRSMFMSMEQRHSAIKDLMKHLAERRPLIVVVDDAQWGFDTLRLLLEYAQGPESAPVFIVATVRTDAAHTDGRALASLAEMHRAMGARLVELSPLPDNIVAHWFSHALGVQASEVSQLSFAAGGNPLCMKALVFTALSAEHDAATETHRTLFTLMEKRYRLWAQDASPEEQLAVEVLAILGQRTTSSEWSGCLETFHQLTHTQRLDSAINAHLIEIGDSDQLSFRHGSFVEAIHEDLKRRGEFKKFNERAAHFLADQTALNHERVAHHYRCAHRYMDAAKHYFEAGVGHRDRSDYENLRQALFRCGQCLRHARVPQADWRWLRLSVFWSLSWRVSGYPNRVHRRIERLCRQASTRTASKWSAFLFMEKARLLKALGQHQEIIPTLRVAVTMAEECNVLKTSSQIRLELVDRLLEEENLAEARTQLAMLDTDAIWQVWVNDDYQVMYRLQYLKRWSILHRLSGRAAKALDFALQSMALAETHPSKYTRAEIHHHLALAYESLGDSTKAIDHLKVGISYLVDIESEYAVVMRLDELFLLCRSHLFAEARAYLAHLTQLDVHACDRVSACVQLLTCWLEAATAPESGRFMLVAQAQHLMDNVQVNTQVANILEFIIPTVIEHKHYTFAIQCCRFLRNYLGTSTDAVRMTRLAQLERRVRDDRSSH